MLLGNEAIARGLIEAGCDVITAYPGTPSSEILPAAAAFADELGTKTVVEWGANEKVAVEVALGATFAVKRACAVMKQVGLNVAMDPFMSAAHFQLEGGMLLVVSDDPGCHASQDDQDSRGLALFAKIPCFDPSSAEEARAMVFSAFELSEKHKVMAMLRPAVRIDHCRQDIEPGEVSHASAPANFKTRPAGHKVVMPARILPFLEAHNARFEAIRQEFETEFGQYNFEIPSKKPASLGVIAGGVSFAIVKDLVEALGRDDVAILKIGTPVPLPTKRVEDFLARHERTLVLEETFPVIENQVVDRTKIMGRWNGWVPKEGELVPEVIESVLLRALGVEPEADPALESLAAAREKLKLAVKKPVLCAGCGHRPSYFAIRKAFPDAVIASDIGCYSLSIQQQAVDTIVCMGASITVASGLCCAWRSEGAEPQRPVFATLGDSTFFHNGMTGLATAVYNRHPFVLAIMDNRITAMTGGQDHPGTGDKPRRNETGTSVDLEGAVRGCGVKYVKVLEAYDVEGNLETIREAWAYAKEQGEPAVLVFRHPCVTMLKARPEKRPVTVDTQKCVGCRICQDRFGCPGLAWDGENRKAFIDGRFCVDCGVCVSACPHGAIVRIGEVR